jgi:hypothetical protein
MKSPRKRVADLELKENLPFQRKAWVVQRIALYLFGLIVLAGLLGLLGPGGFSRQRAVSSSLTLEYDRFLHRQAPASLMIQCRAVESDAFEIWISRDYWKAVSIEHITPEPETVRLEPDRLVYRFATSGLTSSGNVQVRFDFQPDGLGALAGSIGSGSLSTVQFRQFVYP